MSTRPAPARILNVVAVVGMLLAAAVIWSHMPNRLQSFAPFVVDGTSGQRICGRNLALTVGAVHLTREVTYADYSGRLQRSRNDGVYLTVQVRYESLVNPARPAIRLTTPDHTFGEPLVNLGSGIPPGLPVDGIVTFELPDVPDTATLLVANRVYSFGDVLFPPPLDSVIRVRLDLEGRQPQPTVDLDSLSHG